MTTSERPTVEVVQSCEAALGEGPCWDEGAATLVWVDIVGRTIHRLDPETGTDKPLILDRPVGAAVPWGEDRLAVAVAGGFGYVCAASGAFDWIAEVERDKPNNRMNDARCDRDGRFWGGSIAQDLTHGAGTLYRLDIDGTAHAQVDNLWVSNGLDWSPDGATMYLIDSYARALYAFEFDRATGTLSARRRIVELPESEGLMDGMAVDAEGDIWIAVFGGWGLRRYSPSGHLERVIRLPVSHPTSCAFGGRDYGDLFVTTARHDEGGPMTAAQLAEQPLAGSVLQLRPGVVGLPSRPYEGSFLPRSVQ